MPVDDEKVKAALDDFEEEKFSDAKEKLSAEIKKAKNEFLKDKLKLKGDVEDVEDEEEKEEEGEKEEKGEDEKEEKEEKKEKKATKKRVAKAIKKKQDKDEE